MKTPLKLIELHCPACGEANPSHGKPRPSAFGESAGSRVRLSCKCGCSWVEWLENVQLKEHVCEMCQDTHRMELEERTVPCTHCPVPCEACRSGSYCRSTPCECTCHNKNAPSDDVEQYIERELRKGFSTARQASRTHTLRGHEGCSIYRNALLAAVHEKVAEVYAQALSQRGYCPYHPQVGRGEGACCICENST